MVESIGYNVALSVVCQSKASFSRDGQMMMLTATTKTTKITYKTATMLKTKIKKIPHTGDTNSLVEPIQILRS